MRTLRKLVPILLSIILIFIITACSKGELDMSDFDEYIYLPHVVAMDGLEDFPMPVNGAIAHGEYVVYWNTAFPGIVVTRVSSDGRTRQDMRLHGQDYFSDVKGLSISDEGHFSVVAVSINNNDEAAFIYIKYNEKGEEIARQGLLTIPEYSSSFIRLEYVAITDNNIVVATSKDDNQTICFLTTRGEKLGETTATDLKGVVRLKDNRVVALFNEGATSSLREIDFNRGGWGKTHRLDISDAELLIRADKALTYDFLINAGGNLIGYELRTNKQTLLINWIESRTVVSPHHYIGMLMW